MPYRLGEFGKILNLVSDVLGRRIVVQTQRKDHLETAKVFRFGGILLVCNNTPTWRYVFTQRKQELAWNFKFLPRFFLSVCHLSRIMRVRTLLKP